MCSSFEAVCTPNLTNSDCTSVSVANAHRPHAIRPRTACLAPPIRPRTVGYHKCRPYPSPSPSACSTVVVFPSLCAASLQDFVGPQSVFHFDTSLVSVARSSSFACLPDHDICSGAISCGGSLDLATCRTDHSTLGLRFCQPTIPTSARTRIQPYLHSRRRTSSFRCYIPRFPLPSLAIAHYVPPPAFSSKRLTNTHFSTPVNRPQYLLAK